MDNEWIRSPGPQVPPGPQVLPRPDQISRNPGNCVLSAPNQADAHKGFTFPRQPRTKKRPTSPRLPQARPRGRRREPPATWQKARRMPNWWTCPPCLLHLRPLFKASAARPVSFPSSPPATSSQPQHPLNNTLTSPPTPASQHSLHPPHIRSMLDLDPRPRAPHSW